MFCDNCGEKLEEGSVFCPNCGAHIEIEEESTEKLEPSIEQDAPANPEQKPVPAPKQHAEPSASANPDTDTSKNKILLILGISIAGLLLIFIVVIILVAVWFSHNNGLFSQKNPDSSESTSEEFSLTDDDSDYANLHNAANMTVDGQTYENLPAYFMPAEHGELFAIATRDLDAQVGFELQINREDLSDGLSCDLEDFKTENKGAFCFIHGLGSTGEDEMKFPWIYTGNPQNRTMTSNEAFRVVDFTCVSYDPDGESIFLLHVELEDPDTGEEHTLDATIVAPYTPGYVDWAYGLD